MWSVVAYAIVRFHGSRRLQNGIAVMMIVGIPVGPLLSDAKVRAFEDVQSAKAAAQDQSRQTNSMERTLQKLQTTETLNPHVSLLSQQAGEPHAGSGAANGAHTTHPATAIAPDPGVDTDHDGLTDWQEARIGTDPGNADSDGDGLSDGAEVRGFTAPGGTTWYLDPRQVDYNRDGVHDGQECSEQTGHVLTCADTNGDGLPDAWDPDNDGDHVPDNLDSSPTTALATGATGDGRFGRLIRFRSRSET